MNSLKGRIIAVICVIAMFPCLLGCGFKEKEIMQNTMHSLANHYRELGYTDDYWAIKVAQRMWKEAQENYIRDRDIIATVIYNEAWGGCSDRHRELVGATLWNRTKHPAFDDTVYDCVVAPGQYHPDYVNPDSYYGKAARKDPDIWAHCQELADKVLREEVEIDPNVVFQANFKQGDGTYEIHETSYSTTYFCYIDPDKYT